jgi:hypothetical protein
MLPWTTTAIDRSHNLVGWRNLARSRLYGGNSLLLAAIDRQGWVAS